MDVPFKNIDYLKKAFDGLEPGLTGFLEASLPDWIIYDFAHHWLPPVAKRLRISCAFYLIMSPWFAAFFGPISNMIETGDPVIQVEQMTAPPEWIRFPTKVAYKWHEVMPMMNFTGVNASGVKDWYRYACCASGCEIYLTRHCYEFEPEWLNVLEDVTQKPVVPLGLMLPSLKESDISNPTWLSINEWLNKQTPASVVYVALGSEVLLSYEQLTELAHGLELSGSPFFWALRKSHGSSELPNGFEERTRDRGIVWTSWAPQPRILGHNSVGGFLTHCGWGSTVEGLQFGRPLIMLPFMLDQGLNARLLEDKKVGIEIEREEEDGSYTRNSVDEAIRLVMSENEKGKNLRDNAKGLSAIFGDKVLQDGYTDKFVEYLVNHKKNVFSKDG